MEVDLSAEYKEQMANTEVDLSAEYKAQNKFAKLDAMRAKLEKQKQTELASPWANLPSTLYRKSGGVLGVEPRSEITKRALQRLENDATFMQSVAEEAQVAVKQGLRAGSELIQWSPGRALLTASLTGAGETVRGLVDGLSPKEAVTKGAKEAALVGAIGKGLELAKPLYYGGRGMIKAYRSGEKLPEAFTAGRFGYQVSEELRKAEEVAQKASSPFIAGKFGYQVSEGAVEASRKDPRALVPPQASASLSGSVISSLGKGLENAYEGLNTVKGGHILEKIGSKEQTLADLKNLHEIKNKRITLVQAKRKQSYDVSRFGAGQKVRSLQQLQAEADHAIKVADWKITREIILSGGPRKRPLEAIIRANTQRTAEVMNKTLGELGKHYSDKYTKVLGETGVGAKVIKGPAKLIVSSLENIVGRDPIELEEGAEQIPNAIRKASTVAGAIENLMNITGMQDTSAKIYGDLASLTGTELTGQQLHTTIQTLNSLGKRLHANPTTQEHAIRTVFPLVNKLKGMMDNALLAEAGDAGLGSYKKLSKGYAEYMSLDRDMAQMSGPQPRSKSQYEVTQGLRQTKALEKGTIEKYMADDLIRFSTAIEDAQAIQKNLEASSLVYRNYRAILDQVGKELPESAKAVKVQMDRLFNATKELKELEKDISVPGMPKMFQENPDLVEAQRYLADVQNSFRAWQNKILVRKAKANLRYASKEQVIENEIKSLYNELDDQAKGTFYHRLTTMSQMTRTLSAPMKWTLNTLAILSVLPSLIGPTALRYSKNGVQALGRGVSRLPDSKQARAMVGVINYFQNSIDQQLADEMAKEQAAEPISNQ